MFVSQGHLPPPDRVQLLVEECHRRFAGVADGKPSSVYPVLAEAPPDLFGVGVVEVDGRVHSAGDALVGFPVMSVAKPFVFALVCQVLGAEEVRRVVGVNATGRAFNSLAAVEAAPDGRTNPMVNSGALATTALVPGRDETERTAFVVEGLSAFAGRALSVDPSVLSSALATNDRNRAIARLLYAGGQITSDPAAAVRLYTQQSCVAVTALDLAVMAATLADGGVNPLTGRRVVDAETCRHTLAVMATAGLYETSGDWLFGVGLPGKSGIGGGIITAAPGKGGLGTFSPPLDAHGNSVRGQLAAAWLSAELGLDLFRADPAPRTPSVS